MALALPKGKAGASLSVFRQLRVQTRNKKPPAVRVGNKGYTKNLTNLLQ